MRGRFSMVIRGRYTTDPTCAAVGVTECTYNSVRKAKRRNEILSLRAAALDWFLREWKRQGGKLVRARSPRRRR